MAAWTPQHLYSVAWNTSAATSGPHTLTAVARDAAGNVTVSQAVAVTVADTSMPTVSISAPASGSTVSGSVTVTATASDNVGVASVQFRLDGADLGGLDTTAPYSVAWNTSAATSGPHTLTAVARDAAGNVTVSQAVAVTVADTSMPTVSISAPASGSTVSGSVTVTATASDNVGVASVQFRVNGANLGSPDTAAPYTAAWNTSLATNGIYTLTAVARDAAGNERVSTGVAVTVSNASPLVVGSTVQFTSADHLATLPDGRGTVDSYTLEVWLPGSNTTTGQPFATSSLGKPVSTTTTMTVDWQSFFGTLPKGQEFFTTVTATGPGGSARSTASNSFMMQ